MVQIFGFEIKRKKEDEHLLSFAPEQKDDGAQVVAAGGSYGTHLDLDGTIRSEADLVTKYREMAQQPEIDNAVDEIINDAIVMDDTQNMIDIVLDKVELPETIKKTVRKEFENTLMLLDMNRYGYDIFRKWYVDGRIYYHVIVDDAHLDEGIKELRYIDPRKIKKIREVKKIREKNDPYAPSIQKTVAEYFVYNEKGFNGKPGGITAQTSTAGLRIAKDSIVYAPSGMTDRDGTMVLSYLHKAIKPLNQLRALEDATLIYTISRAPERRIFYIDVGSLPKPKAEQHMRDIMVKHKNRIVYDAASGEIRDDRKFTTMIEDYWFARRDGSRGTEVETLPAGQHLGEMDHVIYFQKSLYNSLNVPIGRLENSNQSYPGFATEISRDELKFASFINRLQTRFSKLFLDILEKQLIMKRIITVEEWDIFSKLIKFKFAQDLYYKEMMDLGILQQRINVLAQVDQYAGKYFSNIQIRKQILNQTDEEIEEIDLQIADEIINPQYNPTDSDEENSDDKAKALADNPAPQEPQGDKSTFNVSIKKDNKPPVKKDKK